MKLFQFLNQNYSQEDFIQAFHDIDNKIYNDLTCKDYKRYAILHKNKKYPVKLTLECMCRNKGIFIDRKDFGKY